MSAQIKINSIDLVGTWTYIGYNKDCLCGHSLQFPTKSQIEKKNMYRNNVVIGYCGHGFHEECINNKSIKQSIIKCPNCLSDWVAIKTTNNIKYSVMK
jgi:hypothetical protein